MVYNAIMKNKSNNSARKKYVTVRKGWRLRDIAEYGKLDNPLSITTWSKITVLNGSDNWIRFEKGLKTGQKVRVK